MGKRLENTPRSAIRAAVRRLWARSRERNATLKRDHYTCQVPGCGRKQSRAEGKEIHVEVHHKKGCDWEQIIDLIAEKILQPPDDLETVCKECHKKMAPESRGPEKKGGERS